MSLKQELAALRGEVKNLRKEVEMLKARPIYPLDYRLRDNLNLNPRTTNETLQTGQNGLLEFNT